MLCCNLAELRACGSKQEEGVKGDSRKTAPARAGKARDSELPRVASTDISTKAHSGSPEEEEQPLICEEESEKRNFANSTLTTTNNFTQDALTDRNPCVGIFRYRLAIYQVRNSSYCSSLNPKLVKGIRVQRREGISWKDLHAIGELSIHLSEQSRSFMSELERADFATSFNFGEIV